MNASWIAALVAALMSIASANSAAMSRAEFAMHKAQIESDYKSDKSACDKMTGNDQAVCVEKAKGREKVAKAELAFNDSGSAADASKVESAKAQAADAVAAKTCAGSAARSACIAKARARFSRETH